MTGKPYRRMALGLGVMALLSMSVAIGQEVSSAAARHPHVKIKTGIVEGLTVDGQARFLGIPFGAPPTGDLRWRPPEPAAPWRGVYKAQAFGKSCPQVIPGRPMATRHAEDCLYLDVYLPKGKVKPGARLPVMVWLPGGGLVAGETNDYNGSRLAREGVIVVALNYRVGVLGFFSQPNIDGEGHDFANYGLMDQQLGLKWVHENIAAFGGDSSNVTIFGESAGGGSVFAQMLSPKAEGLFHKGIVQSGGFVAVQQSNIVTQSLAAAQEVGKYFSLAAGCRDLAAACLRKLPLQRVMELQSDHLAGFIIDGNTLPLPFAEAFSSGRFARIPVLNGSNLDEGRGRVALMELGMRRPLSAEAYSAAVSGLFEPSLQIYQKIKVKPSIVVNHYPLNEFASPSEALAAVQGDSNMSCPGYRMSGWLSRYVPTYAYEFTYRDAPSFLPPVSFPLGAAHTSELQFLFPGFHWGPETKAQPLDPQETALADKMVGYWTGFAKSGRPSTDNDWPAFKADNPAIKRLDVVEGSAQNSFVAYHKCAFWSDVSRY